MAARKKNDDAAQFTIVLEDLNAKFTAFGEALQGFRETTSAEFQSVRAEFQSVRAEMRGELQSVRAEVRAGFETTDRKLDAFHDELSLVKTAVLENRREIRVLQGGLHDVRGAIVRVEEALEKKVDRDELAAIVAR